MNHPVKWELVIKISKGWGPQSIKNNPIDQSIKKKKTDKIRNSDFCSELTNEH